MTSTRTLPPDFLERPAAAAKRIAGRLCLDFANGVGGWIDQGGSGSKRFAVRDDRLRDYEDLVAWALQSGVLSAGQASRLVKESAAHPQAAAAVLKRGHRLRAAIHAVAWSIEKHETPDSADLTVLAREATLAREHHSLLPGQPNLAWRLPEGTLPLDAPLGFVALSAEDYFTRGDLTRLHSCPGEGCGWLFEDTTRNRSRRWCDMGDCGNSAKVRKFRARQSKTRHP